MLCFMTNQLFTLRRSQRERHIDCVVLTVIAPPTLGNDLHGSYLSLLFGNLNDTVTI